MKRRSFLQAIAGTVAALPLLSLLPTQAQAKTQAWIIQWQGTPRRPEPPAKYSVEIYDSSGRLARVKHVSERSMVYTAKEQEDDGVPFGSYTARVTPLPPTDVRVSRL